MYTAYIDRYNNLILDQYDITENDFVPTYVDLTINTDPAEYSDLLQSDNILLVTEDFHPSNLRYTAINLDTYKDSIYTDTISTQITDVFLWNDNDKVHFIGLAIAEEGSSSVQPAHYVSLTVNFNV